jgi:hypothetical protein
MSGHGIIGHWAMSDLGHTGGLLPSAPVSPLQNQICKLSLHDSPVFLATHQSMGRIFPRRFPESADS